MWRYRGSEAESLRAAMTVFRIVSGYSQPSSGLHPVRQVDGCAEPRTSKLTNTKENRMKISARNRLKGKIVEVIKGATTAHVRIDVGGSIVTAAITNESVDELGLKVGGEAYAVIKASDVMVGID